MNQKAVHSPVVIYPALLVIDQLNQEEIYQKRY